MTSFFGASKSGSKAQVVPTWSNGQPAGDDPPTDELAVLVPGGAAAGPAARRFTAGAPAAPVAAAAPAPAGAGTSALASPRCPFDGSARSTLPGNRPVVQMVDVRILIHDMIMPVISDACKSMLSDTKSEMQLLVTSTKQEFSRALGQLNKDVDTRDMLSDARVEMHALVTSMQQDFSRALGQLNRELLVSGSWLNDVKDQQRPDLKDGQATNSQRSVAKGPIDHSSHEEAHACSFGEHKEGVSEDLKKEASRPQQKSASQTSKQACDFDIQSNGRPKPEIADSENIKETIDDHFPDPEKPCGPKLHEQASKCEHSWNLAEARLLKSHESSSILPMPMQTEVRQQKVAFTESMDDKDQRRTVCSVSTWRTEYDEMDQVTSEDLRASNSRQRLSRSLEAFRKARDKNKKVGKRWFELRPRDILESAKFDNTIGCVILINAVIMGCETDYMARNQTDQMPAWCQIFERVFLVIFTCELALRLGVHRCNFFCMKEARMWNWFDSFCVSAQLTEEVMAAIKHATEDDVNESEASSGGGQIRLMRIMRTLRIMRILRVVRVLRLISELRTIVSSILGSMRSLFWTIVLLLLMIYVVGVYFTQSVTDHRLLLDNEPTIQDTEADDNNAFLSIYFGNIPRTLLSLYQAMSGGLDWDSLANPLFLEISPVVGMTFVCYIAFSILALLNVVTGVFVQSALLSAQEEEDNFFREQVFSTFNSKHTEAAKLNWADISEASEDPQFASFWRSINVQPQEAEYLFRLLDVEETGTVDFEEFLGGCLRLHGQAKSIDLLSLLQEFRGFARRFTAFQDGLRKDIKELYIMQSCVADLTKKLPGNANVAELTEQLGKSQHFLTNLKQQASKVERLQDKIETSQRDLQTCASRLLSRADPRKEAGTCEDAALLS